MENQKYKELLKLARETIKANLENKELKIPEKIKKKYSDKLACFVTLTINGQLRGCIGSLVARQELYNDVIENSINAAFSDPRFRPINLEDFNKIKIEISVLSKPQILGIGKEVFDKINSNMGIILRSGFRSSTFLPQVWEQISDKKEFLEELSMKAGLDKDAWKNAQLSYYEVEKVEE